jgi:DNA-binding helix-hairpin-helix protein with protein kinase domain
VAFLKNSFRNTIRLVWPDGRSERVELISIGKSGGAGEVFNIENKPGYVAKLYHAATPEAQLAHYAKKIRWMIGNKPDLPPIPPEYEGIVQLAWPVAEVTKGAKFAGFVMEKIDFDRTMELDYLLTRRQAAGEGFEADFGKLVTVCYNLASLLNCLHSKKIAVVDLKPINLKVYKSELYVSILDCDGFHIYSDSFVSAAPQVTPDYLAPEFHDRAVTNPEAQDWFALATIIFRLLNFGIHPYAGIAANRFPYPTELAGRIKVGLYPYGRSPHKNVRATPASVHECFPDSIRELFDRSFATAAMRRASAYEWAAVLSSFANKSAGQMVQCENGHLHFLGKPCPTCLRESIIQGHVERQKRFFTQLQTSPARALKYVKKTLKGTHTSPFQAALAQQGQLAFVQMTAPPASLRNAIAAEILWVLGLIVTFWWLT